MQKLNAEKEAIVAEILESQVSMWKGHRIICGAIIMEHLLAVPTAAQLYNTVPTYPFVAAWGFLSVTSLITLKWMERLKPSIDNHKYLMERKIERLNVRVSDIESNKTVLISILRKFHEFQLATENRLPNDVIGRIGLVHFSSYKWIT